MKKYKKSPKHTHNILLIVIILFVNQSLALCINIKHDIKNSDDLIVQNGDTINIKDKTIKNLKNIIVRGNSKLIFNRTNIYFNNKPCNEYGISLMENSTLEIDHSVIKGVNNLFYFKGNNTKISIFDSHIRGTHVLCYGSTNITIKRSDLWAIHCSNTSIANIHDAKIHYVFLRGLSTSSISDSKIVEIILYDHSYANVKNTTLKNIFYFDEGWTTLTNCNYIDLIRFKPKKCNLTIRVIEKGKNIPVIGARINLRHVINSAKRVSNTNKSGYVKFNNLTEGDYNIDIQKEGYDIIEERISLLKERENKIFKLIKNRRIYDFNEKISILSLFLIFVGMLYIFYDLKKTP